MLFLSIGVGNDNNIKSELLTASSIFVVAEKSFFSRTSLKIFSYPGSSFKGNFFKLISSTNFLLMSTPIVCNPDFAKDNAVGKPIRPMPITHTRKDFESNDFFTSSKLFIFILKSDMILRMIF